MGTATATSRRKPAIDESEQPFSLICSFAADIGQKGHFAQLLQFLADQLGDRFSVKFYAGVRKSASNSGDVCSGSFRHNGLDAGASQRRGVNLVYFAQI